MRKRDRDPRRWIVSVAEDIGRFRLSDFAGGNVSLRAGDLIYMTPRYTGSRRRWRLEPKDIVVVDFRTGEAFGRSRQVSREATLHLAIYREFPDVGAVIHAHPFYSMVFACKGKPILPTAEYTEKLGAVPLTEPAPAHSPELAEAVVKALTRTRAKGMDHGMAVLIPFHGVVCVGRDLDEAFDILNRVETSARIRLYSTLLGERTPEDDSGG